jgi:preprotein translocase subunit YajC
VHATLLNLAYATALFADAAGDQAAKGPGDGSSNLLTALLPFAAIFVLFYFLLIRPQKREQARRQDMLGAVKKNDRIVTVGGIYGVVTNIHREADEVTIKVDEATNTKLRITLSSVGRVLGDEPAEEPGK